MFKKVTTITLPPGRNALRTSQYSRGGTKQLINDIASAMDEVKTQQPGISRRALLAGGFSVARHVAGTMSTTLPAACPAEYTAMIMTFIAQGYRSPLLTNLLVYAIYIISY